MRKPGVLIRAMATALVLTLGITSCALDATDPEEDAVAAAPAAITAVSTITGTVFQDMNRNGAQEAGETAFASIQLYLFDGNWAYLATTTSDAAGHYAFGGLADGAYQIAFASPSWWSVRHDWVPTTTAGSLAPRRTVSLSGTAVADFGLRPIVRSADLAAPIATVTGPNGLVVKSYDDVVSPQDVYAKVMAGLVGQEAPRVVVHFDYGSGITSTSTSVAQANGQYSGYQAYVYLTYEGWLDGGDIPIAHEYGHAWSLYYAYMAQQDPTMASYLAARGLTGDPRVNSNYAWNTREMIAEDYRQLLGAPSARSASQLNAVIPAASAVPGLGDFLQYTFTQSAAAPPPPPPPTPALAISGPTVTPSPVVKSGTISFGLSIAAQVTLTIRATDGSVVRTLLASAPEQAGSMSVGWNRKDGSGHHVKAGTYVARVDAVDASSQTATSSTAFQAN